LSKFLRQLRVSYVYIHSALRYAARYTRPARHITHRTQQSRTYGRDGINSPVVVVIVVVGLCGPPADQQTTTHRHSALLGVALALCWYQVV
jgi:hypothetical protein